MFETISAAGQALAILIRSTDRGNGTEFVTDPSISMQLAAISHPRGQTVAAHHHPIAPRTIAKTCETLIVRSGRIRVDLYDNEQRHWGSRDLGPGDVILLIDGGHGVEVLEDVDMIEVKTGPFTGDRDKIMLGESEVRPSPRPAT